MTKSPVWSREELEAERLKATELFRKQRLEEPLEEYLEEFDQHQGVFEELLEASLDLKDQERLVEVVVTDPKFIQAFRYLAGPPISADDLKVLADATLAPTRLRTDREMARRVAQVVMAGLDRRRFPWVAAVETSNPSSQEIERPDEAERNAAVLASAALLAMRRLEARRRKEGGQSQEDAVKKALTDAGLTKVKTRTIHMLAHAPQPGQFCGESTLGDRKADIVVGLWDGRTLPIECKVSNSATNSVKRLNDTTISKTEHWFQEFGKSQVVPTAVLSGVYKLHNLMAAQDRELTLFWAHDLSQLTDWINSTKA